MMKEILQKGLYPVDDFENCQTLIRIQKPYIMTATYLSLHPYTENVNKNPAFADSGLVSVLAASAVKLNDHQCNFNNVIVHNVGYW